MRRSIVLAVPLLAFAITTAQLAAQPAAERSVDSLFASFNEGVRPGLAVGVVRDGKLVFARGYGMASLEHRVKITPATVFDVASVSKQFAGLSIAMLVDRGQLRLDDDVRRYIPELDPGQRITIDHLVHHTSGLRDWPGTLSLAGWRMDDVIDFPQILRFAFAQRSLNFTPGSEYTYSNTGYNMLAEVVRRVSGKSFRQFTDDELFKPLGMSKSHFHDDVTMLIPDRAFGYMRTPEGWRAVTDNLTALGSSSLFTSVEDMAKWVANFDDAKVGGARAMSLMRTRGRLNNGTTIPYAFGVSHGEYRGLATIAHSGSWAQFSTFVVHFPTQRAGVIVFANSSSINATDAAYRVVDAFFAPSLAARARGADSLATMPAVTVTHAMLDRYVGHYKLGPGWYVEITRKGDVLTSQASREQPSPMSPRNDSTFWVAGYNAAMVFADAASGTPRLVFRGRSVPRMDPARRPTVHATPDPYVGTYESKELATRYDVRAENGGLVLYNQRHGQIPLTRLWGDDFTGNAWFARSLEFKWDAQGRARGIVVNIDERSRDVWFERVR